MPSKKENMEISRKIMENIYNKYASKVYTFVMRMIFSEDMTNDITQDVFLKVFRNLQHFRGESALSTYIYRIAYNNCIDYIRKMKKDPIKNSIPIENIEDIQRIGVLPEEKIEKKELYNLIYRAVDTLPEQYRTVLTLFYFKDIKYKQIGEIMDIPEGTVKTLIYRAKIRIRKKLQKEGIL